MSNAPEASAKDSLWRRAAKGAVEGLVGGAIGGAVIGLIFDGPGSVLHDAALWAIACAVVVAIGRSLSALRGAMIGTAVGVVLALVLFRDHMHDVRLGLAPNQAIQIGQELELAGPLLDGKPFDLKELRGKVVLVDFWATWCPPCVAEMPGNREVYRRHQAEGFEIVGVSLDESREALVQFTGQHDIKWRQIFFPDKDKPGGQNPLALRYRVDAIPLTVLVDRQGKVVDLNLRGREVEPAVEKALAGSNAPSRFPFGIVGMVVGFLGGAIGGALIERRIMRTREGEEEEPEEQPRRIEIMDDDFDSRRYGRR
jgi:thiol-disulfide isomerase/thioredoxin